MHRRVGRVLSTVGVMFAPDQERAADELVRVTVPGGKIALASWTPSGMVGHLFKTNAGWAAPPAGLRPAVQWGTPERLAELFGDRVEWVSLTTRQYVFRYHSPEHYSQWFRDNYGPMTRIAGYGSARRFRSSAGSRPRHRPDPRPRQASARPRPSASPPRRSLTSSPLDELDSSYDHDDLST